MEPLKQGLYSGIKHKSLGGFLHLTFKTTYTYTKLQLFQKLLLNGTPETGSLQQHQLLKSWQVLHSTYITLTHKHTYLNSYIRHHSYKCHNSKQLR